MRGENALHPLLAEGEGVAEGAGAAETGVDGAEVDAALAAAEAGVDRDRGREVGPVVDAEGDGAAGWVGGDLGGCVLDHALFRFFGFQLFFLGDFGAEPRVFFVFDDAVAGGFFFVFFGFVFSGAIAGFVVWRGQGCDRQRQAQRLRRYGDRAEGEQGIKQGKKQFSHRSTIGASSVSL